MTRIYVLAAALLVIFPAVSAFAQSAKGPTSWAQSVMDAPSAVPATGDVVGFVHNGVTHKCVVGSTGCFNGGGGGGSTIADSAGNLSDSAGSLGG